jgi:PDZ domain-containing protein
LSFTEVPRYPSKGQFLFVTIRQPELSTLSWLMFGYDRNRNQQDRADTLLDEGTYSELFGDQTPQQQSAGGRRQMVSAKQASEYVALKKLGFPIDLEPGEISIEAIVCLKANESGTQCAEFAPSGKTLKAEDKLLKLDGEVIESVEDIAPILTRFKPGDLVDVEYDRPGVGVQTGTIQVIASPDDDGRTIVGFFPVDTTRVGEEPFTVNIDTAGIGGPSAGLAFTLTLIDEITPGELTGGNRIAVTGTMNVRGEVGAIGGLAQKALAVTQTGTKYFLVPKSQSPESIAEARENAPDLTIIPVGTLDEALAELAKLGGNANDLGTPGADFEPAG